MKRIFLIIIIVIVMIGAVLMMNRGKEVSINESFEIRINQTAVIKNENLKIRLLSIVDNTCPKDAVCIRAGEIEYNIKVNSKTIKLDNVNNKETTYNDYLIKLDNDNDDKKSVKLTVEKIGG